ncbi:hypothetical protein GCM10027347_15260 [Larkinella harenae]
MKNSLQLKVLVVGLFAIIIGCERNKNNDILPHPYVKCRIVKTIYKTPTIGRKRELIIEPEIITLSDGSKVEVSLVSTTIYTYDTEGRITEEYEKLLSNNYTLTKFKYNSREVYRYKEWTFNDDQKVSSKSDTISLNELGLVTKYYNNSYSVRYDTEGYPTNWGANTTQGYYVYKDENVVKLVQESFTKRNGEYVKTGEVYNKYIEYNLNHLNLPATQSLIGKVSFNLPIREKVEVFGFGYIEDGIIYEKNYNYFFDNKNRVKRRIAHGKAINSKWGLEEDLYGIGVTNFEYECK